MFDAILLLATALAAAAVAYLLGQRSGERRAREQAGADLDRVARAAAEEVLGPAAERFRDATRSEREVGRELLQGVAEPLRDSLERMRKATETLERNRTEDAVTHRRAVEGLTERFVESQRSVQSLRDALNRLW